MKFPVFDFNYNTTKITKINIKYKFGKSQIYIHY